MSATKKIRSKIKSVESTQKITRAMQMVATSKMRKTQDKMRQARPYAEHIRRVVAHLARVNPYAKNLSPFLRNPTKCTKVGVILISSDKGLCGGLNANNFKLLYNTVKTFKKQGTSVDMCAIGHKGYNAIKRIGLDLTSFAIGLGDVPQLEKILGPLTVMLGKFENGELDAVHVIYAHFTSTMQQDAVCEQLLPLDAKTLQADGHNNMPWDYEYEPDANVVIDDLMRRYVESVVYQCLADNMAAEQAARMMAMRAATDNATEAIHSLRLIYNKSRQAAITKELAEIVAGSAAV